MSEKYLFEADGVSWYLNLSKIWELIRYSDSKEINEKEFIDSYELLEDSTMLQPVSKVIREYTNRGNAQIDNMKYDLIKSLLLQLLCNEKKQINEYSIGDMFIFNTLVQEEIIIRVKNGEETRNSD